MSVAFEKPWYGIGVGGSLALDFANTLDWRLRDHPEELLHSFTDLVRWARTAGVLDPREARTLRAWGITHPQAAARVLTRAVDLREAMAAIFQEIARGKRVPAEPLAQLDAACREASAERALLAAGRAVAWAWRPGPPPPSRPAWEAALDAARLLISKERDRVRQCADAQCGWLFLDTSRNRSRRWCTMKGCGNRNKARSFYRRARKNSAA